MKLKATGMVLGKFLPPTRGHQYLVDFARHYVTDLTVVVGSLQREPIPGAVRWQWMQEMFPDVKVVHLTDENPQYPDEHPDFWRIWHDSLRRFVPEGPDFVFASEEYGFKLAEVLGARYVPVDLPRAQVTINASAVREDPMANWDYLPSCVRPWFVRKVCIVGPESTGKSILAARLAGEFGTVMVAEYARGCIDTHKGRLTRGMFEMFVRGQAASEAALARQANRVLICDSDAFTTALYHELYEGDCPAFFLEAADASSYDLYLLTCPDTPYVEDAQRNHKNQREWFFDRTEARLREKGARHVVIRGSWDERFDQARAAVGALVAPVMCRSSLR